MGFDDVRQAVAADPELAAQLAAAASAEERVAILSARGIEVPAEGFPEMSDAAAGDDSDLGGEPHPPPAAALL